MQEISKKKWSQFCRDMVSACQFASTSVVRIDPDGLEETVCAGAPLLKFSLVRRKGKISAFEVQLGEIRNSSPAVSLASLGAPVKILHKVSSDGGAEIIEICNEDGYRLIVQVSSQIAKETYDSFVEEMAYFLAEARDFVPGHEREDWILAERLVRKIATPTTKLEL